MIFFFRFLSGNISSGSNLLFSRFDFSFLSKLRSFPLLKRRQTPLSNSESVKFMKNVIDFFFRKWN